MDVERLRELQRLEADACELFEHRADVREVGRVVAPYSGHIDATLDESGRLDVGAVAVRTDVARRVGFGWRHHAADFSYVRAVLEELARVGLEALKLPQTLYVHN